MSHERTVGMTHIKINGALYEAPLPVYEEIERLTAENQLAWNTCEEAEVRCRRLESKLTKLERALIAALEWSESIEQGPFGEMRPDGARVRFHRLAKGLVYCPNLVNLSWLSKAKECQKEGL